MKIEQRGFGITDIGARVAGIDVENGGLRIAFVANVAGDEALTPPLDADDVKALIEALTVAHGLMAGETPPANPPADLPARLAGKAGNVWRRLVGTNRYTMDNGDTREWIEHTYGLVTGETPPVGQPTRKLVGLRDRVGDMWLPTADGGWSVDSGLADGRTRAYVEDEWGPVAEVWQ